MSTPKNKTILEKILPARLKNGISTSLLSNLFDRFLTKDSSVSVTGWIGDTPSDSLAVKTDSAERNANALEPVIYTKYGTQENVRAFRDILAKAKILGIDIEDFARWGAAQKFNFAPPVNFDKLINFSSYRWVGNVIPNVNTVSYNLAMSPEYVTVGWPVNDSKRKLPVRVASTSDVPVRAGFQTVDGVRLNKNDRVLLKDQDQISDNGIMIVAGYDSLNPPRIIITGNVDINVNGARKATNTIAVVDSTGLISGIILPSEPGLGYVVAPDVSFIGGGASGATATAILNSSGTITGFSITNSGANWARGADFNSSANVVNGSLVPVVAGTTNHGTYWQLNSLLSSINVDNDEIEFAQFAGKSITDWTATNYWIHENDIETFGLSINATSQAVRPILEYDFNLELNDTVDAAGGPVEFTSTAQGIRHFIQRKTSKSQSPLFNLYVTAENSSDHNATVHAHRVSSIFAYTEKQTYAVDSIIGRRISSPSNAAGDYEFSQSVIGPADDDIPNRLYFYKLNDTCTSIWAPGEVESPSLVSDGNAAEWNNPAQLFYNVSHETRPNIKFGDMQSHISSILDKQSGFDGSPLGKNNSRTLTLNYGLGGKIRDYNSAFNLFLSLMNQQDISPLSIIDFAQSAYEESLNGVNEYLNLNLASLISRGVIRSVNSINTSNQSITNLVANYLSYIAGRSDIAQIYGDSTSAVKNWPATLPYLGFASAIPSIMFDNELGLMVLRHHDGHKSPLITIDSATTKDLVHESILRSDGLTVPGIFSATAPANPYKNQLWFNTVTGAMYVFDVISDTHVFAADIVASAVELALADYQLRGVVLSDTERNALISTVGKVAGDAARSSLADGDKWYDRTTGSLYAWDLAEKLWTLQSSNAIATAFKQLDLSKLYNSFVLAIEEKLYAGIPAHASNGIDLIGQYGQNVMREAELAKFAARHNLDPYLTDFNNDPYSPANPFTWNYSSAVYGSVPSTVLGITPGIARWHQIYKLFFKSTLHPEGTARPNLEPWVLTNQTEAAFRSAWPSNTFGSSAMWTYVRSVWNKPLGVRTTTNELMPPYVAASDSQAADALLNVIPSGINAHYSLGDFGPVELAWSKSIDYNYALARTAFKYDPILFLHSTWGDSHRSVNDYDVVASTGRKNNQSDVVLHGEPLSRKIVRDSSSIFSSIVIDSEFNKGWTLVADTNYTSFSIVDSTGQKLPSVVVGIAYSYSDESGSISFTLRDNGVPFEIGDTLSLTWDSDVQTSTTGFTAAIYKKYNGMCQTYSHLLKYHSMDSDKTVNVSLLRDWEISLGYCANSIINTDLLAVKSDLFQLDKSDFNHVIKSSQYNNNSWLESLRIQLVSVGATVIKNDRNVPAADGADWKFRIELYNYRNPELTYYELDTSDGAAHVNFDVLNKSKTSLVWKQYQHVLNVHTTQMPIIMTGIQNVVNFIFGYAARLNVDGWTFDHAGMDRVDLSTGRISSFQLEIEKFINMVYDGMPVGSAAIINPFMTSVRINTPIGLVAELKGSNFIDLRSTPCALDVLGAVIPADNLKVIRTDSYTEIKSDIPMASVHCMLDMYEHALVFKSNLGRVLYDPFLGIRAKRLHIETRRQSIFDGKPSMDGHFMLGNEVSENIETSVNKMLGYYSTTGMTSGDSTSKGAQSLLGYKKRDYFSNIGVPDNSAFNFWKGMINNKGSNLSIDAFLNSAQYKSVNIDEYWAYKVASYGDSRPKEFPEIKLNVSDTRNRFTVINFSEVGEESSIIKDGTIVVSPTDENRWFTINDVGTTLHFDAQILKTVTGSGNIGDVIQLGVIADDISGPAVLVNSVSAKLTAAGDFTIKCFGPAAPKFSPAKLFDYRHDAFLQDIPMWDPARGLHNTNATSIVDIEGIQNPAKYNASTRTIGNSNYDPLRPWGSEQVGTVWWDTSMRAYLPYSDSAFFPDIDSKLNRWGALTDWASIDMYEWISSPVQPAEWTNYIKAQNINVAKKASGSVALPQTFYRDRQWSQRPIAWKYSSLPPNGHNFVAGTGQQRMIISGASVGKQSAILNVDRFSSFGITQSMQLSAFDHHVAQKPLGNGTLIGAPYAVIGREDPSAWQNAFYTVASFSSISVIASSSGKLGTSIGPIVLSSTNLNSAYQLKATALLSGISQSITVASTANAVIDFTDIGIKLVCVHGYKTDADIVSQIAGANLDIYIREAMELDIAIQFPAETVDYSNLGMSNDDDDNLTYGFAVWQQPTAAQLLADLEAPNNRWLPVNGDYVNIDFTPAKYDAVASETSVPLIMSDGTTQSAFSFVWGDWKKKDIEILHCSGGTIAPSISFSTAMLNSVGAIDTTYLKLFIDGILRKHSEFTISGATVTFNTVIAEKSTFTALLNRYIPSSDELDFDPAVKDDLKVPRQFKVDYEYSVSQTTPSDGAPATNVYHFWVRNKTSAPINKAMSINAATQLLMVNTEPYLVLQNYKGESVSYVELKNSYAKGYDNSPYDVSGYDSNGIDYLPGKLFPRRYTTVAIFGLSNQITRDDTYKLRFTRNFTLRNDPNEIDLKNVHTEWTLIRQNQTTKIPSKLWELLTDAACGQDVAGNLIPSLDRIDYDETNGTFSRFGFGEGQSFVDKALAIGTIKFTILNTALVTEINGVSVSDTITTLDFSKSDTWFSTVQSTRFILTQIWSTAKASQINEIFFAVLHDALSNNYEFTDIFKTSMLSASSVRSI